MRNVSRVLALTALAACGGAGDGVTAGSDPVASVTVSGVVGNLLVGQSAQLTATPRNAASVALPSRAVVWSTSNAAILSVSQSGRVTAVAAGTVTVTATSEGKSGSIVVTVAPVPLVVTGTFTGVVGAQVLSVALIEAGGAVTGTGTLTNTPTGVRALTVTGSFVSPTLDATLATGDGTIPFSLQGTVSANAITASLSGSGFSGDALTLYRSGSTVANADAWAGTYALATVNGVAVPGDYTVLGYASRVYGRTLSLAADGTGTWKDSSSSNLSCGPGASPTTLCDASGRGGIAWLAADYFTVKVVQGATISGRFVSPKTFVKQRDGSLLKTDNTETEIYKRQ